jgi:ABC-type iron transport system FetAB permease component
MNKKNGSLISVFWVSFKEVAQYVFLGYFLQDIFNLKPKVFSVSLKKVDDAVVLYYIAKRKALLAEKPFSVNVKGGKGT